MHSQQSVTGKPGSHTMISTYFSLPHSSLQGHNMLWDSSCPRDRQFPKDLMFAGWEEQFGRMHSLGDRAGLPKEKNLHSAPSWHGITCWKPFYCFYTCISTPHQLTNTKIRTRRLDRDNLHVIQIKAIQQVLAFQYHPCQREYDR